MLVDRADDAVEMVEDFGFLQHDHVALAGFFEELVPQQIELGGRRGESPHAADAGHRQADIAQKCVASAEFLRRRLQAVQLQQRAVGQQDADHRGVLRDGCGLGCQPHVEIGCRREAFPTGPDSGCSFSS